MKQVLVIKKDYFDSLQSEKNIDILRDKNYISPKEFLNELIEKLNEEFNFLEISD